jgi:Putative phage holin Dp-1
MEDGNSIRPPGRNLASYSVRRNMNSKLYNFLKAVAQIWLPALGTLMFTIGDLWNLTWDAQAVGSIMALDTFLGVILGLSSRSYNNSDRAFDGTLKVDTSDPLKDKYHINVTSPLIDLPAKKEMRLKVLPSEISSA